MAITLIFIIILGAVNLSAAGTITANIDGTLCPGEELILNCVGQGTSQRWLVYHVGSSSPYEYSFTKGMALGTQYTRYPNQYTFTLIATEYNHFESSFSTTARQSLHNTRIVCNDIRPPSDFTIRIAGAPSSPLNIDSIVDEYYANYSIVTVTWDRPTDHSRVDYYQYQYQLTDELVTTHNTTNTSFTHFGVPYNENVSISIISFNCIGKSIPAVYKFNIAGCNELNSTLYSFHNSSFSQAPGTQLVLSCNLEMYNNNYVVNTTCQHDGIWEPHPVSHLCQPGPISVYTSVSQVSTFKLVPNVGQTTTSGSNVTTVMTITSNPNTPLLLVYVFAGTLVACLCTVLVGMIITICVLKQIRKCKRVVAVPLYDEINDPIYAIVPGVTNGEDKSKQCTEIESSHSDACREVLSNVQTAQLQGFDIRNNTAYVCSNSTMDNKNVPTTWNDSYQIVTSIQSHNNACLAHHIEALNLLKEGITGDPTDIHNSPQQVKLVHLDELSSKEMFMEISTGLDHRKRSGSQEIANCPELSDPNKVFKQDSEEQDKNEIKDSLENV